MKKRLISILLVVSMLFTQLPVEAMALMGNKLNTAVNTVQEKENFKNTFIDVREGSWYYDAVQYARINEFFSGTSTDTFNPDGMMTRSMFVTVLGRMAGVDHNAYKGQSVFSDVEPDDYYAPFVAWASKHGITMGVGNGKFNPNGIINREQMAVFLVNYFESFGIDYDTGVNITTIPADIDTISPWAREMVLKLWKTGLLAGDGVSFNPTGIASRGQAATLCMRTDKAVKIWYREPGVPSYRVSVDLDTEQKSETLDSSTGSNSKDNSKDDSTGGSNTIYYKVTFVTDSTREEQVYQRNTLLSTLPIPAQPVGKVFLGWYHDIEKSKPVNGADKLTSNITLYAKFADAVGLDEGGTLNYVSALDQESNFSIVVKSESKPKEGIDFKFKNITAPDKTPETVGSKDDNINIETVEVKDIGSGVWEISSASGGFTPGHTYQIELLKDDVTFDDSAAAFGNLKENNNLYDITEVCFFNFSIEKDGTLNLKLNNDIKYIKVDDDHLNAADGASLMEYAGLYLASTDSYGVTTYTANNGSGSFTYTGEEDIQVGDTVAVYEGTNPTERNPEKGPEDKTDNGDVSYVKIVRIDRSTYYYVAAEAEDVIFTPDVLPIDVDGTDSTKELTLNGSSVSIDNKELEYFISKYEEMSQNTDTTVDVGDYLAFYTGDFGKDSAKDKAYGEILNITDKGDGTIIIEYENVNESDVMSTMDMYDETQLSEREIKEAIDENKDEIQRIIEAQLVESGFFDDAGEYLAELALQTDEVRESFGDGLTMSDCVITYADGTPIGKDDLALMGNILDKEQDGKKPNVSVTITPELSHFDPNIGGIGLRVEVAVDYTFKIQKSGSKNIMEVNLTAFFEQEVTIGFSVSGGAVWKKKWIFPYIADYRMNGNLDLGTYTGIGITATAKLTEDEEPWGMPWPSSVKEAAAANKIFNLGESIREAMEELETVFPEEEASASGGLAEKYADFMEDANKDWVDLVKVDLINLRGGVDPLHILAYGLDIDFVVSANMNVAIGMTFQYENSKRHSFTLTLKSKNAESNTVDLSTNGYQFDFYVMGHLGIRAGIRAKATVGLFSTKLAGIGLQIETGAYARLWGYFYYHLENWKIKGVWQKESGHSGALLIEIGAYLDLKFIAEALNGKYSYAPTIYAKEWPLWSAGQRENVYDFAYDDDPTYDILNVETYTIPSMIYDMLWMDLKTGELEDGDKANTKSFDSKEAPIKANEPNEEYFVVELSNLNFTYNPVNNQVAVNKSSGAVAQSCDMKITWKGAPLSGSSEVLSRNIKLNWSNEANAATIAFDTKGGSAVQMIRLLKGTTITDKIPQAPTRLGYAFAGWYMDENLNTPFTWTVMPEGNTTLYAKWTPNSVNYIVEHYKQKLDGQYEIIETETLNGIVGTETSTSDKGYEGFKAKKIQQQSISADGSTRITVYYDRETYELRFIYGENSIVSINLPYGSQITEPLNPTRDGYVFNRWNNNIPDVMPARNQKFEASWTPATDIIYMVKHIKQNSEGTYPTSGELVEIEALTGTTGQDTEAEARTYTGFTAEKVVQKTISADGKTVVEIKYPRDIYKVTWMLNDEMQNYIEENKKYGAKITLPETPIRQGYAFEGWYVDNELTNKLEDTRTMSASDITLYAKWEKGKVNYTVKHIKANVDGTYPTEGELVEIETLTGITGEMTVAEAKPYEGFTVVAVEQKQISADGSTVVEIRYTRNSYKVTWILNDETQGKTEENKKYGSTITLPETPVREEYIFQGWYSDAELANKLENTLIVPASDITLYAKWEKVEVETQGQYTVRHIRQDLEGNYQTEGELVEIQTLTGTTGGMTVAEAKAYEGFTVVAVEQKEILADGSTLVEVKYSRNTYNIIFDGNGADAGTMESQTFVYGVTGVLNTNGFTREGYTFKGWSTSYYNSTVNYKDGESLENLNLTSTNIYLYAQWQGDGYNDNEIWVNGVEVTPVNADNILGDNSRSVSYDASTKTLTLNNATLTKSIDETITYGADTIILHGKDLTLKLIGDNEIIGVNTTGSSYGIRCDNLTIKGDGSLNVVSGIGEYDESSAIVIDESLTINSGTLNVRGKYSGLYMFRGSILTINGGTVIAQSDNMAISGYYIELNKNATVKVGADESTAVTWDGTTSLSDYEYFHFDDVATNTETESESTVEANYTVKHMKQSLDGDYIESEDLIEIEQSTNYKDGFPEIKAKEYDGFIVNGTPQITTSEEGSTLVIIKYARNSYNLIGNLNYEGAENIEDNVKYGASILMPTIPTREGYHLEGWYTDATLENKLEEDATMPNNHLTLYAKWIELPGGNSTVG